MKKKLTGIIALIASLLTIVAFFTPETPKQVNNRTIIEKTEVIENKSKLNIREALMHITVDDIHFGPLTTRGHFTDIELLISNDVGSEIKNCELEISYRYDEKVFYAPSPIIDKRFYLDVDEDSKKLMRIMTHPYFKTVVSKHNLDKFELPAVRDTRVKFIGDSVYSPPQEMHTQIVCDGYISNMHSSKNIKFFDWLSFPDWFYTINDIFLLPYLLIKGNSA